MKVGRDLIDGLTNPTVVRDNVAKERFDVKPMTVAQSIELAINGNKELEDQLTTDAPISKVAS